MNPFGQPDLWFIRGFLAYAVIFEVRPRFRRASRRVCSSHLLDASTHRDPAKPEAGQAVLHHNILQIFNIVSLWFIRGFFAYAVVFEVRPLLRRASRRVFSSHFT